MIDLGIKNINLVDNKVFEDFKQGDLKAFDTIFKSYYPMLCIYATDIIKSKSLAEEIVQDVFLKLWNNRLSIQINSSVKAYLFRMVHNYTLNYIRHNSAERKIESISLDDLTRRSSILNITSSYNLLDELIFQEVEQDLTDAIAKLPSQCKEIFCLARYQHLSYTEIATKLDISVSTVKSQMLRSMGKLKTVLKSHLK